MDLIKYLTVLVVFLIDGGDTGGHGGKHHDHVRIHLPKFIHHDHHTKVITIHHHHHKPKKEHHHHHHHHHPKPHIPSYGHHYHKHHTKLHTTTKTVTKGKDHKHHGHHGHHGHHHGHHHGNHHGHHHGHHDPKYHGHQGHHGSSPSHHGHRGHHIGHHAQHDPVPQYNPPTYNYDPPSDSFDDFVAFSPAAPTYTGSVLPQTPRVHGVTHTVKQVNVFDSLPGAIPGAPAKSPGYEVTEAEEDEDTFNAVNSLEQTYPSTFGFVRGAAPSTHDPFAEPTPQVAGVAGVTTLQTHDPFATAPQPTPDLGNALDDSESFTSIDDAAPFSSLAPEFNENIPSVQPSPSAQFPGLVTFESTGIGDPGSSFVGATGTALVSEGDHVGNDSPVSFSREAGIQQVIKTGGVETLVY